MKVITGTFQYSDGTPVAGGRLFLRLSQDAVALSAAQIAPLLISFTLDNTGSLPANTKCWFNDELTPAQTTYIISVVPAGGGLAYGPENINIAGSTFNLNTAQPTTQNVMLGNPVLQNPTAAQTITGFNLNLVTANLNISSGNLVTWNSDTGFSRDSAGVIDLGNGTQGDKSGTIKLANVTASTLVSTPVIQGPGFQKQLFVANGTFTIPTGITQVKVTVVASGGSGGGATAANTGSGGGAGSMGIKWLSGLTPGNTLTVVVGAAATGGAAGASGNNGNTSSVASGTQTITTITTNGGGGGNSNTTANTQQGGAGGIAGTGGDINSNGQDGLTWSLNGVSGGGGNSIFGGGGIRVGNSNGNVGSLGAGGGGAGAGNNNVGGASATGAVLFEWIS